MEKEKRYVDENPKKGETLEEWLKAHENYKKEIHIIILGGWAAAYGTPAHLLRCNNDLMANIVTHIETNEVGEITSAWISHEMNTDNIDTVIKKNKDVHFHGCIKYNL